MKKSIKKERLRNLTREYTHPSYTYEVKLLNEMRLGLMDDTQNIEKLMTYEYHMINEFIGLIHDFHQEAYPYPISKIIKYINAHANEKLTVNKLADIFHLHPDYLSKLFKKEVGINLTTFIQNKKTELAKNFLTYSQMTVTEIATLLDFSSHNYFSRAFRRVTNMTPLEYRKSTL
jgi:AraC-like DNA-binding protein